MLLTKVVSQGLSFIHLPVHLLKCLTLRHLFPATILPPGAAGGSVLHAGCSLPPFPCSSQRCRTILPFSSSDLHGLPTLLRASPASGAHTLHGLGLPTASSLAPMSQAPQHSSHALLVSLLNSMVFLSVSASSIHLCFCLFVS